MEENRRPLLCFIWKNSLELTGWDYGGIWGSLADHPALRVCYQAWERNQHPSAHRTRCCHMILAIKDQVRHFRSPH